MIEDKNYQIHKELIERCRVGDRLAQREIYRLYYKAMYNTCYRMLNNAAEAEDVMQESFLSAFSRIHSYKGETAFGAWLKRIVINKSIDVLRTRKVIFEEINEKISNQGSEENNDIERIEYETNGVDRIKKAMGMLPEGFRLVLTLFFFEGFDHEEIAMILNIGESTSRSQLTRAKKKLMEYLKNTE
jgi:RNA polymerase sigma-70 factor (ECF subfamily)